MFGADIVGYLLGIFQVDGILAHTDGECLDRVVFHTLCDGAYERRIQTAGKKKSDFRIRYQTLAYAFYQLVVNVGEDRGKIIFDHMIDLRHVPIADELTVFIVMSGREGEDLATVRNQVLCFACKSNMAVLIVAVV